jgi:hypothetical protein
MYQTTIKTMECNGIKQEQIQKLNWKILNTCRQKQGKMIMAMATVGEKTWATSTLDNTYTRGITKTFRHKLKIVVWGSFKYQYTLQCIQCHGNSNVLSSQLLSSVLFSHVLLSTIWNTLKLLCEVPMFFLWFSPNLDYLYLISNITKTYSMGAKLTHVDR